MEIKKNHNKYQIYYRCPNFPKTIYESFDSLKKQIFVPHKLSSTRKAVFGYRILPSPKSHTFSGIYQLCIHPFSPVHVTAANPQRTYNTLSTHSNVVEVCCASFICTHSFAKPIPFC